jgi:hypothetical protein
MVSKIQPKMKILVMTQHATQCDRVFQSAGNNPANGAGRILAEYCRQYIDYTAGDCVTAEGLEY